MALLLGGGGRAETSLGMGGPPGLCACQFALKNWTVVRTGDHSGNFLSIETGCDHV